MRHSVQGEIRHNSLRSTHASLGTYSGFPLHSALHLKGGHYGFRNDEIIELIRLQTSTRPIENPSLHLRIRLIDAEASTRETL